MQVVVVVKALFNHRYVSLRFWRQWPWKQAGRDCDENTH